jgi:peptidyl-prolyl cis-trans isomerase C
LANEDYIANPDAYRTEEILDISHILIGNQERSNREAEELAKLLATRLETDPSIYGELVTEYSDDPAKKANGGRYPEMHRGQMVSEFEQAAFALKEPGQISAPVQTAYGFHIIRLNARHGNTLPDYAAVKDQAVIAAKRKYYENYQQRYLRNLLKNPIVIPDGAVEIMARRHFGDDLELAPDFAD